MVTVGTQLLRPAQQVAFAENKPVKNTSAVLLMLACAALLSGCDSDSSPLQGCVRCYPRSPNGKLARVASFAGTIEPRYSASLAFRVLGRVIDARCQRR